MLTKHQSSQEITEVIYVIILVLTIFTGIHFAFFAIISLLSFLLMFIPKIHSFMMQQFVNVGATSSTLWEIVLFWIVVLVSLGMRFLMTFGLFKLVKNIRQGIFFDSDNTASLKTILLSYGVYAIVQYIGSVTNQFLHFTSIGLSRDLLTTVIVWLILYVTYLSFKNKQNSNI